MAKLQAAAAAAKMGAATLQNLCCRSGRSTLLVVFEDGFRGMGKAFKLQRSCPLPFLRISTAFESSLLKVPSCKMVTVFADCGHGAPQSGTLVSSAAETAFAEGRGVRRGHGAGNESLKPPDA